MSKTNRTPQVELLHVDDDLLIVDKPANVILGRGNVNDIGVPEVLEADRRHAGVARDDEPYMTPYRIDPQATGVVVYARSAEMDRVLTAAVAAGEFAIRVEVIVAGYAEKGGEITTPVRFDKRRKKLVADPHRGDPARTVFRLVERLAGHSVLECDWDGRRLEQIRVHCAEAGWPLAIDALYGSPEPLRLSDLKPNYRPSKRREERPLLDRLSLHIAEVAFNHPRTQTPLRVACERPKDFRATINQLARLL